MRSRPGKYNLKEPLVLATRFDKILTPKNSALELMSLGRFQIARKHRIAVPKNLKEETALFCVKGHVQVQTTAGSIDQETSELEKYDTLYIPVRRSYEIKNIGDTNVELIFASAPSETEYRTALIGFEKSRKDTTGDVFMKLKDGRELFMLLNPDIPASKLQLGFCIYHPSAYSSPPHTHDDQEEVYIFLKGRGRMEVYLDEDKKELEERVEEGDVVTIPFGYYHPVYNSEEEDMHFLYLLAGARYRIGDKVPFPKG